MIGQVLGGQELPTNLLCLKCLFVHDRRDTEYGHRRPVGSADTAEASGKSTGKQVFISPAILTLEADFPFLLMKGFTVASLIANHIRVALCCPFAGCQAEASELRRSDAPARLLAHLWGLWIWQ